MIRLAVNLATRRVHASVSAGVPLSDYTVTRGDIYPVELSFFRDGAAVTPDVLVMILKKSQDFTGDFLALCNTWTNNSGVYSGALSLNTVEAQAAVGDAPQISAALEITWQEAGGEVTSIPLPVTLLNDYHRGNEGVPQDALPPYPLPGVIVTEAPEDGKAYGRKDGQWVELPITSPNGLWRIGVSDEGIVEAIEL